jgi:hypothetical protein
MSVQFTEAAWRDFDRIIIVELPLSLLVKLVPKLWLGNPDVWKLRLRVT